MTGVVTSNPPSDSLLKSHSPDTSDVKQEEETNRPIAPSATPAASRGTEQPRPGTTVCQNCLTTTTPLWRRDENGQILCNACGLFFKLHGRRRPISLKTDVIKSRNRSRNTSLGRRSHPKRSRMTSPRAMSPEKQRSASAERPQFRPSVGVAPSQQRPPATATSAPVAAATATATAAAPAAPTPITTSHIAPPAPQVANNTGSPAVMPSYVFDPSQQPTPVRTPQGTFPMPSLARSPALEPSPPNIQLVRGSMSELLLPRSPPEGLERVPPLQHIKAADLQDKNTLPGIRGLEPSRSPEDINKELGTRVSELELVNDLLKRRIADLEYSESQARRTALDAQQTTENLWKQLNALKAEKNDA